MESIDNGNAIEFLEIVGRLKHMKRTGWVLKNVKEPECIASHMYRMAILSLLLDDKQPLDSNRCLRLAIVHDLAEAIVGDITPNCGIDPVEKHRREDEAMKEITAPLGDRGSYIYELYKEYEMQSTPEAKFVKDTDRFDMLLQAFEYEKKENNPKLLQEFFDNTKDKLKHPIIQKWNKELENRRSKF